MRPRDPERRKSYREAVERLKVANIPVSLETVSVDLGIKCSTIRNFMFRNPRLAKEIGLATHEQRTGIEYLEAAERVARRGDKLNGYTLAKELGRDHSAAYRFLRNHMSVRSLIYESTGTRIGKAYIPESIVPKNKK